MYTMSQINHIKDLSSCGYRISEISKETGADPKTIKKYLAQEDFSPMPPVVQGQPSKMDPFKPVIQEWQDEDKRHWRKQHHTAKRVYERLVEEEFSVRYHKDTASMEGIFTTSVTKDTLDECPMVYKPMEEIIANIKDTVTVDMIIKPIYNFKASNVSRRK